MKVAGGVVSAASRTMTVVREVELLHRADHDFVRKPSTRKTCLTCGQMRQVAQHSGTPVSLNAFGSGGSQFVYQTVKRSWHEALGQLLAASDLPRPLASVHVIGEMCFPHRRPVDQGNYRYMVEKALGDVLQTMGYLPDDSWDFYTFGDLAYRYEKGQSWTRLLLFPVV
jgi:hypothetical protein